MQWLRTSRGMSESGGAKQIVIFHSPEMKGLAQEILTLEDYSQFFKGGEIVWKQFEDGFPNLFIQHVESLRGRHVVFLASFLNYSSLLAQLSVIYALPRYLAKSLILVLPYFPTGTMERVECEGDIATASTLARLLSAIPLTQRGASKLIIYDIHTLQNRFYFGDNVVPLLVSGVPLLIEKLRTTHVEEDVVIAFPDEGACKRFGKAFGNSWELVICTKVREGDKRIVTIKEGDVTGKHVFIIDDLVKTGGTLIECKQALLTKGAAKVSAFVTHAVFPLESWRRFTDPKEGEVPFTHFYTTNSCPEVAEVIKDKRPFHILSLAESIAEAILRY
jgi:ribose-phosphate pyrophosphokinase